MTKGMFEISAPEGIIINAIAHGFTATPLLGIHEGDSIYSEDKLLYLEGWLCRMKLQHI